MMVARHLKWRNILKLGFLSLRKWPRNLDIWTYQPQGGSRDTGCLWSLSSCSMNKSQAGGYVWFMGLTLFHLSQRYPGEARAAANPSVTQSLPGLESLSLIVFPKLCSLLQKVMIRVATLSEKADFQVFFFFFSSLYLSWMNSLFDSI